MRHVPLSEARDRLSALINEVAHAKRSIVLESHGKPKAALVCIEDLRRLEAGISGEPAETSTEDRMLEWLARTESVLAAPRSADGSLAALDEVREGRVAEEEGLYRRQRRTKAGRRRKR